MKKRKPKIVRSKHDPVATRRKYRRTVYLCGSLFLLQVGLVPLVGMSEAGEESLRQHQEGPDRVVLWRDEDFLTLLERASLKEAESGR